MRSIVVDTNLLVLLVVGLTDRSLIEKHKRTRSFEVADFELLTEFLSCYDQVVVTPHILTEASNLISQIGEPALSAVRCTFATLLATQKEEFQASHEVASHNLFIRLGLTDCAILNLVKEEMPFITVDLDLYLAAAATNINAENFNHIRAARLLCV